MADFNEVESALLDAIQRNAVDATGHSPGTVLRHAQAAAALAEALAWLKAPYQPHGGSVTSSEG